MPRVYLGVGSNLEPGKHLRLAVRELRRRFGTLDVSPVYRSAAVGFEGRDFLNLVVGLDTSLSPAELVEVIESIHRLAGRERGRERNVSRTLDIDLLTYGEDVRQGPPTSLPRADILDYAFVLKPLADLAPEDIHPETGRRYRDHWEDMAGRDAAALTPVELELDPG